MQNLFIANLLDGFEQTSEMQLKCAEKEFEELKAEKKKKIETEDEIKFEADDDDDHKFKNKILSLNDISEESFSSS